MQHTTRRGNIRLTDGHRDGLHDGITHRIRVANALTLDQFYLLSANRYMGQMFEDQALHAHTFLSPRGGRDARCPTPAVSATSDQ